MKPNYLRTVFALLGIVIGIGMTHLVRADDGDGAGTLIPLCAGDCQAAVPSCCSQRYNNRADCMLCCSNTFTAYPNTYCGRNTSADANQCYSTCPY